MEYELNGRSKGPELYRPNMESRFDRSVGAVLGGEWVNVAESKSNIQKLQRDQNSLHAFQLARANQNTSHLYSFYLNMTTFTSRALRNAAPVVYTVSHTI